MNTLYRHIKDSKRQLAVLIDPDKMELYSVSGFVSKVNQSLATHIFVGGSEVEDFVTEALVIEIKKHTALPVVLFPGDTNQITDAADGLLFLSLISGRNPEYLIGKQIEAVSKLKNTSLEIIPTGYILIEGGKQTAVERVSQTNPLPQDNRQTIVDTAKAGELLGMKLIYLEAGSGAKLPIASEVIKCVKQEVNVPLIVGGAIRSKQQLELAYNAGADLVVIGTAFEEDDSFLKELKAPLSLSTFP